MFICCLATEDVNLKYTTITGVLLIFLFGCDDDSGALAYPDTESLATGMMLEGTTTSCDNDFTNCVDALLTVEIYGEKKDQLQGIYTIDIQGDISKKSFIAKRCVIKRELCGLIPMPNLN